MNERCIELERLHETPGVVTRLCLDAQSGKKLVVREVKDQAPEAYRVGLRMEAAVLSRLHSPYMPGLIRFVEDGLETRLEREYLEGMALEEWLRHHPSRTKRKQVFVQVVQLLQQIHQAGYLYLDLKAGNVLIGKSHTCLVDFNSCLPIGSWRPLFVNKDSLPPECLQGQPLDERADQIGLGRLYLQLLGPSWKAWTMLSRSPARRFASLEQLEAACTVRRRPVRKFAALGLACACLPVSIVLGGRIRRDEISHASTALVMEQDATALAQAIANGEVEEEWLAQEVFWVQSAAAALKDNGRSLSAWLLAHVPQSDAFDVRFYDLLLSLQLGHSIDQQEFAAVVSELPKQLGWQKQFDRLLQGLIVQEMIVDAQRLDPLLEALDHESVLDEACCESLLGYLLMSYARTQQTYALPESLAQRLSETCEQAAHLYFGSLPAG